MKEVKGNIWAGKNVSARVITTNGSITKDFKAVMGRGIAKEASLAYPDFKEQLGKRLFEKGNRVYPFVFNKDLIFTFPVKHRWFEKADISLIANSCLQLLWEVDHGIYQISNEGKILIPRPGCGNGGLEWDEVKPVLEEVLDDRFHVISLPSVS